MPDISDAIAQAAADGVQSATAPDGRSTTAVPIPHLIEADKHLAGKSAVSGANARGGPKSPWRRLRQAKVVPPGAV